MDNLYNFLLYLSINLIYIILNCTKDILRQKGTKFQSMLIATISSTVYVILIKKLVDMNYTIIICGTILANMMGDFIGRTFAERLIPRQVICYRYTICKDRSDIENIIDFLENNDLGYKYENAHSRHKEYLSFQVYTKDKEEDRLVENMLNEHNIIHYNRGESRNKGNINLGQNENNNKQ